MSDDAKHLIQSMLITDPKRRPSAEEIMKHNWFLKIRS